MELRGTLHFWSETGTEGGHWAFQDKNFISPPAPDWPHERWSYEGLHVLEDGDILVVYSKEDPAQVIWTGTIKLKVYEVFAESAFGMWIHTDQKGVDREIWTRWFFEEYPATLIKFRPR